MQDYSNLQKLAMQQSQTPMQPNPKKPSGGFGCIFIIIAAVFFLGIGVLVFLWVYPKFHNNEPSGIEKIFGDNDKGANSSSFKGTLSNALLVSDENGKNKIWIISYRYKNSSWVQYTYIFDPYEKKIIKSMEAESKDFPPRVNLYFVKGEVLKVVSESKGVEAGVFTYDPITGEEKSNTRAFISKYPELQEGFAKLYTIENPPYLNIETKDGRKPVYDIYAGKLYSNYSEMRSSYTKTEGTTSIFGLGEEKSGESARKKLYLITGPKANLWDKSISESYVNNPSTLKFFAKSEAKTICGDKVFLEGILPYQDDECCFVFYQDKVGNNAERLLSCVNIDGEITWTESTEKNLFDKLRASDKESNSSMFFLKSSIHVSRQGDAVILSVDRIGVLGLDYKTGKVLFKEELANQ